MNSLRLAALTFALGLMVSAAETPPAPVRAMVGKFCVDCHDAEVNKGKLNLAAILSDDPAQHGDAWEKVVRRLRARQMPPAGKARPDETEYAAALTALEAPLDRAAAANPKPGRTETIRRLNRTEYQNAIRDLLAVEIDAATLLPADEASHGFDNVTVGTLSPTLLDRYISAAQKISRLSVGGAARVPGGETYRIKPDITQEGRIEGLPFGTRGGAIIRHTFPQDGEYEIQLRLARDRNDLVEGLKEPHQLLVLVDGAQAHEFTVKPPGSRGHDNVDTGLNVRLPVRAGVHQLGITFRKNPSSLQETLRQPYNVHFNFHRHPRQSPALYQVSVTGPFNAKGPGDSASRRRIFGVEPASQSGRSAGFQTGTPGSDEARRFGDRRSDEEARAKQILSTLLRRAWRRPVNDADLARVLPFYHESRKEAGFDAGIESALSAILVSREFLFRAEQEPKGLKPGTPYRVSDIELASRLSFFIWSSIPDDELLELAERSELAKPPVLAQQTRRMLADARAESLVKNFAGQWLHLRNLDSITPDGRLFPDFDDNLRQAMRRETEMLFEEILRDDRSVLDLLRADHTFLNERLAKHYEIPHIYGTHFRRVALGPESQRGGLLRHGSVLTVTSYATRTSPVIRGKWVLENLIGTPPPPPEPDVPALDDSKVSESLPIRERLAAHRNKPACASCHEFIDPPGFALENYDAVGRWRTSEAGLLVDNSGGLPDGSRFNGVAGIEAGLLARPEIFTAALTEKLLTFALGRGVEPFDGPAVREVLRAAKADNHRLSAIILAIVNSTPFQMRQSL
ncbi:MAG: DUF1592 domain-containing protein [Verrucomicrobia bacterium]|nr:DUF1592 domain-containing protein [Verrucomicrobiota bacterium]